MNNELEMRARELLAAEWDKARTPENDNVAAWVRAGNADKSQGMAAIVAALSQQPQPRENQTHPPTSRREQAVSTLLAGGWKWDGAAWQQPSAVDAGSVVATLCHSHKKFAEWWDDLGERRALLFMRALTESIHESAAPQQAAGVPEGVNWESMYRIQTAMRYMDNIDGLTRDKAYSMADEDVAGLKALAAPKPEVKS